MIDYIVRKNITNCGVEFFFSLSECSTEGREELGERGRGKKRYRGKDREKKIYYIYSSSLYSQVLKKTI